MLTLRNSQELTCLAWYCSPARKKWENRTLGHQTPGVGRPTHPPACAVNTHSHTHMCIGHFSTHSNVQWTPTHTPTYAVDTHSHVQWPLFHPPTYAVDTHSPTHMYIGHLSTHSHVQWTTTHSNSNPFIPTEKVSFGHYSCRKGIVKFMR